MLSSIKISPYVIPGIKLSLMPMIKKEIDAEKIIALICSYYNLNQKEIKLKRRQRRFVLARSMAIYFLREQTDMSWDEIAKMFSPAIEDHTTAIHSFNKIRNFLSINDKIIVSDHNSIIESLK